MMTRSSVLEIKGDLLCLFGVRERKSHDWL
jgi:hypothetical protein